MIEDEDNSTRYLASYRVRIGRDSCLIATCRQVMLIFYPSRLSLALENSSALFGPAAVTEFMKRMHDLLEAEEAYDDLGELTPDKAEEIVRAHGDHIDCQLIPLDAITSVDVKTRVLRDSVVTVDVDTSSVPAGVEITWPVKFTCDRPTATQFSYLLRYLGHPRPR